MSNLEQAPIKKEGRISPKGWNRILLAAGVIYTVIYPIWFLAFASERIDRPDPILRLFNAVFGSPAPIFLIMASFFPIVAIIYALLYREATRPALALVVLTILDVSFVIINILLALLLNMLNE